MFLTKLKRWMFIAESTRPKSMTKARNDREDLQAILQWLGTRNMVIDFSMYQEKSKDDLLPGVALLLALNPEFHSLLERVLSPEDFKAIL